MGNGRKTFVRWKIEFNIFLKIFLYNKMRCFWETDSYFVSKLKHVSKEQMVWLNIRWHRFNFLIALSLRYERLVTQHFKIIPYVNLKFNLEKSSDSVRAREFISIFGNTLPFPKQLYGFWWQYLKFSRESFLVFLQQLFQCCCCCFS